MPIVDGGEMVNDFATGIYAVTRFDVGTYVDGVYVAGSTSTLQVKALVMPAGGQELRKLPEGLQDVETFMVLSVTELKMDDTVSAPDRLVIPGRGTFELKKVEDWTAAGGFYKYLVQKVDQGDGD